MPPKPDYQVAPGAILAEILEERGIAVSDFARDCGRSADYVEGVIDGSLPIPADDATAFGRTLVIEPEFFANLRKLTLRRG